MKFRLSSEKLFEKLQVVESFKAIDIVNAILNHSSEYYDSLWKERALHKVISPIKKIYNWGYNFGKDNGATIIVTEIIDKSISYLYELITDKPKDIQIYNNNNTYTNSQVQINNYYEDKSNSNYQLITGITIGVLFMMLIAFIRHT